MNLKNVRLNAESQSQNLTYSMTIYTNSKRKLIYCDKEIELTTKDPGGKL